MKTLLLSMISLGLTGILGAVPVSAQAPYYGQPYGGSYRSMGGGFGRPGLSPYLNMLRGGSPAANYYLGVVPEFERRARDVQYGSALFDLERRAAAPVSAEDEDLLPSLPGTGHPAVFGYYQPYYNLSRPALGQPTAGFGRSGGTGRRGR